MIHQGQVAVGDELSRLFSEYRFGEQKTAPRAQVLRSRHAPASAPEGKMSYDEFKEAVSDAMRNGDSTKSRRCRPPRSSSGNKVFEPWKKRAIDAGLLPEDVDVKTADSYVQRLYNKQAIAAKRPEFVDRVTDWLAGDQQAKAQAQSQDRPVSGRAGIAPQHDRQAAGQIEKLETDADVIAARQEETTRINKAANQRATNLRNEGGDQDTLPLQNARGGACSRRWRATAATCWPIGPRQTGRDRKPAAEAGGRDRKPRRHARQDRGRDRRVGGQVGTEAKAALKARAEAEKARDQAKAAGTYKGKDERLSAADKAVDKAVRRILGIRPHLSRDELRSRATRSPTASSARPTAGCPMTSAWSTAPHTAAAASLRAARWRPGNSTSPTPRSATSSRTTSSTSSPRICERWSRTCC
jgi:hypothetical protein